MTLLMVDAMREDRIRLTIGVALRRSIWYASSLFPVIIDLAADFEPVRALFRKLAFNWLIVYEKSSEGSSRDDGIT